MPEVDPIALKTSKRIKAIRMEKRMYQSEVAKKAKMSINYYSKIETAKVRPSISMYERISKALGIKSSDIFPF